MKEQYERICQSLRTGCWAVDYERKSIQFDTYLQTQFQLSDPVVTFDNFMDWIIPEERHHALLIMQQFAEKTDFSVLFTLQIKNTSYRVEAVLNASGNVTAAGGHIRIIGIHSSISGNTQPQREQGTDTNLVSPFNERTCPSAEELHTQISLVCQTGIIFPFLWNFREQSIEFTVLENGRIVRKQLWLSEFEGLINTEDRKVFSSALTRVEKQEVNDLKIRFRSDFLGKERWFEMSGKVVRHSEDHASEKVAGILYDVTAHVLNQEIQGKNEQLLLEARKEKESAIADRKLALDNLNTALVYMDRDFVVQWNSMKTMKTILGENAYAIGEPCYKSTFNRDAPCEDCPVVKLFSSKKPEMHRIVRSGEILEVMANPVFNEKKELIGGVLKLDKITERVKQENLISELNTLMDAILNNIPVYLYVKDPNENFKYLYWNKAIADSRRIPASEVLGRTDEDIAGNKKEALLFRENDLELLDSEGKMYFIEEYEDLNGDLKVVSSLKTLIPAPNKALPWIMGISWDITELKRNEKELIQAKEKAEESNRLKSAFLANMSHEIRTPLNAIVGFSDLLSEVDDEQERTEYVDIIKNNNELLLQLISDILDLSKIEAQSIDFVYETVNIFELVNQVVAAGNVRKEAKVPVLLDKHEPDCFLYTDRNRVNQVLSNFVGNALKFTSEGHVRVGYHNTEEGMVKFYVSDTGTGIDPDKLNTVFERFVKLDTFKQGTGLGLSICKSIVEELKGAIGVESEPGKGSCFWFTLPCKNADKDTADLAKGVPQQKRVIAKIELKNQMNDKPTILVAEDLDSNYILVDRSLRNTYNLVRARTGVEAVELYNVLKPDMILMDIQMPEMDGLQAAEKIRKRDRHIPIIAFSAYSFNSNPEKARRAGCDDFLAKPVSASMLRDKVDSYITYFYGKQ